MCTCEELGEEYPCKLQSHRLNGENSEYYVIFININSRYNGWKDESQITPINDEQYAQLRDVIKEFEAKQQTDVRKIEHLHIAGKNAQVWYFCPLPEQLQQSDVYCCQKCFQMTNSKRSYQYHLSKCQMQCPPGNMIYQTDSIQVYEIDGASQKVFVRNACYVARMFLEHKTLMTDVDIFLFYFVYYRSQNSDTYKFVGFFSKEKPLGFTNGIENVCNCLSCILTLPIYQGTGFGRVLIDLCYMLSTRDNSIGTPEKPLSDLGYLAFKNFWTEQVVEAILMYAEQPNKTVKISDIVKYTNFTARDIIDVLVANHWLLWTGTEYVLYMKTSDLEQIIQKRKAREIKAEKNGLRETAFGMEESTLQYYPDLFNLKGEQDIDGYSIPVTRSQQK